MYHRENINNVKREKRMADFLGHSDNLITLSLSLSLSLSQVLTYNSITLIYCPRGRIIYGFPCFLARKACLFFIHTYKLFNIKRYDYSNQHKKLFRAQG